jgi:G3E family GTPase
VPMPASPSTSIPVYLLTGFLGSGKTTLLTHLLRRPAFADTAVIINEFGQIGLDDVLVSQSTDTDVVLLDSGCLCCAVTSSLQETLESLYFRLLRAEAPHFSRVIIETSGLADPGVIINTLAGDPLVARFYRYAGAVVTVDAVFGLESIDRFREAATQVAVADRIAITKADIATPEQVASIRTELARINPSAQVSVLRASDSSSQGQAATGTSACAPADLFANLEPSLASRVSSDAPLGGPLSHIFRYGISSYVLRCPEQISWSGYAAWVRHLQRNIGDNLLRAKGILRFEDGSLYAIHGVKYLFNAPAALDGDCPEGLVGSIIVITRDVSAEEIAATRDLLCSSRDE